jgi:hypothetical protein
MNRLTAAVLMTLAVAGMALAQTPSVTFLGMDTTTLGNWKGVYGQDGFVEADYSLPVPAYAGLGILNENQKLLDIWSCFTNPCDPRELLKQPYSYTPAERVASYYYQRWSDDFEMNTYDGNQHRVALYFADYEFYGRTITVIAHNTATGAVLDTRPLNNYSGGVYLIYNYTGSVDFEVLDNITPITPPIPNGTISGIFWGGSGGPPVTAPAGPVVSFSPLGPAPGSTVSGKVSIQVGLDDVPQVTSVQLQLDGQNLGAPLPYFVSDLYASPIPLPFNYTWDTTTTTNCTHTLTAIATDTAGYTNTSPGLTLTVNNGAPNCGNTPPSISISSPGNNSVVSNTTSISVNVADGATITGVQYQLNGSNLGPLQTTGPNYTFSWNTTGTTNGPYTLTAILTDNAYSPTTSSGVSVTVSNAVVTPPSISITSPGAGTVSNTTSVSVNVTDSATITGVQYQLNGNNLGPLQTTGPNYTYSWNTAATPNGPYTLTAILTDNANSPTTSPGVSITVSNAVITPTISINPVNSTVSGNLTLSSTTSANIVSVQYYLDNVALGSAQTTAPFSYTWNTATASNGPHALTAIGSTALNATVTSATVNVTVNNTSGNLITFLGQDTTTLGNWKGVYGQDGNYLGGLNNEDPSYVSSFSLVGVAQDMLNLWEYTDQRALLKPQYSYSPTERVESIFYAGQSMSFQLNSTNNQTPHLIALYFCDYLNQGESVTVKALDGTTGNVLNTQVLTNYTAGIYLVYNYQGNITFVITNNVQIPYGPWSTVAAFFWGGTGGPLGGGTPPGPSISITSPTAGSVSNTTSVSVNVSDSATITGVQYQLNGTNLGPVQTTGPHYTYSWNTTTTTNGPYTLTAILTDNANSPTTSAGVAVTVSNAVVTPPSISISSPTAGTVSNTTSISVNVSDSATITGVQYQLNGINLGPLQTTGPNYTYSWNTTATTNGPYTLTAILTDNANSPTTSTGVALTVSNQAPAPPTISINSLNSTVSGNVNLSSTTSSNVVSVQYYLDNVALGGLQTTAPFSYTWNTETATNGLHTLTAVASTASNVSVTANGVQVTVSNTSSGTGNSVTFVGQDTTTLGNWKGVYGNDGNYLGDMVDESPSYASVSLIGLAQDMLNLWEYTDTRALLKPQYTYSPTERVESVFLAGQSFSVGVNSSSSQTSHRIALYFCDYLNQGESVTVQVLDGTTGNVLNTQVLTSYTAGVYLVYNYTGNITFVITNNIQSPYAPWATVAAFFWG